MFNLTFAMFCFHFFLRFDLACNKSYIDIAAELLHTITYTERTFVFSLKCRIDILIYFVRGNMTNVVM